MNCKNFYHRKFVNIYKQSKYLWITAGFVFLFAYMGNGQSWSLQQCIDTALVYNKNLQMGRNQIVISEEKQKEAKAGLLPKVNLNADYRYFTDLPYQLMPQSAFGGPEGQFKEMQMGVPHNISTNIQVAVPVFNPNIRGAVRSTEIASELTSLQYKKSEEQVWFEVSNLYYNAQILVHQQQFIKGNLENTGKLLGNLKLLYSQQMVKKSDVTKVELQWEQLNTQLEWVTTNLDQVKNALKFTMGISFQEELAIEEEIGIYQEMVYEINGPADLEIARIQKKFLLGELGTLKNSRLPSVSLYGSYGQTGFGYDKNPNDFLKFFPTSFAGLQLTLPVFNGTATQRKINQKKIEIENSGLQVDHLTGQNQMLVENALQKRGITTQTIENSGSQLKLAETVYNEVVLQQKEGTITLTEVLLADNALREAQQNRINAFVEYLRADLELKKLTGNITFKK
jgi:OMF family outer membrane factor